MIEENLEVKDALTDEQIGEVYRSIGAFIVHFSRLEEAIKVLAGNLLALSDNQFYGVMPVIDFRAACNICVAQLNAKRLDKAELDSATKLVNRTHKLADDRNRVAHAFWFITGTDIVAWHASRSKLDLRPYFEKRHEIDDLTKEVRALAKQILKLMIRFSPPEPQGVAEIVLPGDAKSD